MARPETSEYASHYGTYVTLVPEVDIVAAMRSELAQTMALLNGTADHDASVCHPPYTWTIKQVVGHLTDCERVFGYRALRFGRGDSTPLPGFDENNYARFAESDQRPLRRPCHRVRSPQKFSRLALPKPARQCLDAAR